MILIIMCNDIINIIININSNNNNNEIICNV